MPLDLDDAKRATLPAKQGGGGEGVPVSEQDAEQSESDDDVVMRTLKRRREQLTAEILALRAHLAEVEYTINLLSDALARERP